MKEGTLKLSLQLQQKLYEERKPALQQKRKQDRQLLPFVTQYRPSVPNLKQILMQNWNLIQQPSLRRIFKDPLLSRTKGANP